jgi:hypothetical protein
MFVCFCLYVHGVYMFIGTDCVFRYHLYVLCFRETERINRGVYCIDIHCRVVLIFCIGRMFVFMHRPVREHYVLQWNVPIRNQTFCFYCLNPAGKEPWIKQL